MLTSATLYQLCVSLGCDAWAQKMLQRVRGLPHRSSTLEPRTITSGTGCVSVLIAHPHPWSSILYSFSINPSSRCLPTRPAPEAHGSATERHRWAPASLPQPAARTSCDSIRIQPYYRHGRSACARNRWGRAGLHHLHLVEDVRAAQQPRCAFLLSLRETTHSSG